MFYRYHIANELWPSFSSRESYYLHYLLPGKSPTTQLKYETQYKTLSESFKTLKIQSSIKVHIGRKLGSNEAVKCGATLNEIQRLGGWNLNALQGNQYV